MSGWRLEIEPGYRGDLSIFGHMLSFWIIADRAYQDIRQCIRLALVLRKRLECSQLQLCTRRGLHSFSHLKHSTTFFQTAVGFRPRSEPHSLHTSSACWEVRTLVDRLFIDSLFA